MSETSEFLTSALINVSSLYSVQELCPLLLLSQDWFQMFAALGFDSFVVVTICLLMVQLAENSEVRLLASY